MAQKYLIFISSAVEDVKAERAALARVIWELGHVPVMPDGFDAADSTARRIVKRLISDCDYFLTLTAHKYGLMPNGESRLTDEYLMALKAEAPVLALIIDEKARWKGARKEQDEAAIRALEDFKVKLRAHPHAFWATLPELENKARELLLQEMFLNPRQGWSPGGGAVHPQVVNELGRLIVENEKLKKYVLTLGSGPSQWQEKIKHTLEVLTSNNETLSFFYAPGGNWENTIKCRYLRLFKLLAPELYTGKTIAELSRFLGSVLNPDLSRTVRKDYPVPSNTIKKIMADFNLLKLVQFFGKEGNDTWELTEFGKEIYAAYRLRQFERRLKDGNAKMIAAAGEGDEDELIGEAAVPSNPPPA